ncbi:MAG: YdeI/OmpD-associated family protein [Rhodobacteraceae bacterium]|nr:YdeI/OmpD-associated family protein [Paracoccaceae bacterium]
MAAADTAERVEVRSRAELRDWLARNHGRGEPVWLVTYKKSHPSYLPYEPIVEELICWGWIDSLTRKLDDDRTMLLISARRPDSAWSALNKAHVERARASGAMTPAGEAKVAVAVESGMWDFLDDVDQLQLPDDLTAALVRSGGRAAWDTWPRSVQRGTLEWIKLAKTAPTRARRIAEAASAAGEGRRPAPFRR